jgi:hypothetical protein
MVSWSRSRFPLLVGRPARIRRWVIPRRVRVPELVGAELRSVIGDHVFELPAGLGELGRDPVDDGGGVFGQGIPRACVELGPGVAGGNVDRVVLPDGPLGAQRPSDLEAVEADDLAGPEGLDLPFRLW